VPVRRPNVSRLTFCRTNAPQETRFHCLRGVHFGSRREIAIRTAVGAGRRSIRNLVLVEGFRLIAGGVIIGMAAALVLSRVLRSFLFGVETTDPVALIGVVLLFAAVALLAFWIPATRATQVDPLEALRYE
jgi:putative ABC transport system permease protein